MSESHAFFPVGLSLQGRKIVVIGAGRVAERKIRKLLEYATDLLVISPAATSAIEQWSRSGKLVFEQREAKPADVAGADLVFITTNDAQLNSQLAEAARAAGTLVNRADGVNDCDFILPAAVDHAGLQVAVFTAGEAPVLARMVRDRIAEFLQSEFGEFPIFFSEVRRDVMEVSDEQEKRSAILERLVNSDLLQIFKSQGSEAALQRARQIIDGVLLEA